MGEPGSSAAADPRALPPDPRALTLEPGCGRRVVFALARRPALWATAVRVAMRIAAPGWWRRPPFLPRPDRGYLAFRVETAYGARGVVRADDVVAYLGWCRAANR